jgi:hypothetical protein
MRNRTSEIVTKRENRAGFAVFCFLIILSVSITACTTTDSGTNKPRNPDIPSIAGSQPSSGPVSITVNSAEKLLKLNNMSPSAGKIFLVLNITVKNNGEQKGFVFVNKSVTALDLETGEFVSTSLNANPRIRSNLSNPIVPPTRIGYREVITGQLVFAITDSTEYRLNLTDIDNEAVSSQQINFGDLPPVRMPVSITINSARKMARVNQGGLHTRDAAIFVVLNITVKNNDVQEGFDFANTSTSLLNLENSNFANRSSNFLEKMDRPLQNPIILPTKIAPDEAITGEIVFRIYDSAKFRLNLVDSDKTILTSLPVSFESLTTTDHPVSVTLHSVEKRYTLNEIRTGPGEVFVIINMTVKNNDLPGGFYFYEGSTTLRDLVSGRNLGLSFNEKQIMASYDRHGVENAFILPRKIKQNEAVTGKLVFATANSNTYLLNLVDYDDTILLSRTVNAG